ncbi:MAG: translation initiation factor IF-2 [Dehalococcoidia bacterium]|nr:translation initiation factor IF-2 [Dehalococcoidia bacterium]MDW8119666.1 translation initiation factor IF-2 [Chloroflexota bacterium]
MTVPHRASPAPPGAPPQRLKSVELPPVITVRQLAEALGASPIDIIKHLMRNGIMATINQAVDFDTAAIVAADFGFEARKKEEPVRNLEQILKQLAPEGEDPSLLRPRPPVITILGHVDHGKTTLLDAIRQTNVAAQEVGGITQHIGAYQIEYKGHKITFLDTPGHEAFTAMRARGAQVTDIAVLVVAADDGVMPQTVEALNHARAANVPIVVAINKIDKPGADPERVKRQLAELGLIPEEWGGDTIMVPISAKMRKGIDDLLETLLLVAEMRELKANPHRPAVGVVIEAKVDKSKGPVATVLVQTGTLHVGDNVVVGDTWGRVKALLTDTGRRTRKAEPAMPVEVLGLDSLPQAGDTLIAVPDEKTAKEIVEARQRQLAAQKASARPLTLEDLTRQIQAGEVKELPLILKCDVQGSVEAVKTALEKVQSEKAKIKLIHSMAGTITESDVLLAMASRAIIIGFTTRVEPGARRLADKEGVQIRTYDIIYDLVEDVRRALVGLTVPEEREVVEGHAQVKAVFPVGKKGKVAGCLVTDGKVVRGAGVRVLRGGKVVYEGQVTSLRRVKEDVREVAQGFECGVGIEGFIDFQEGDILEVFRKERVKPPTG